VDYLIIYIATVTLIYMEEKIKSCRIAGIRFFLSNRSSGTVAQGPPFSESIRG